MFAASFHGVVVVVADGRGSEHPSYTFTFAHTIALFSELQKERAALCPFMFRAEINYRCRVLSKDSVANNAKHAEKLRNVLPL